MARYIFVVAFLLLCDDAMQKRFTSQFRNTKNRIRLTSEKRNSRKICVYTDNSLKARKKSCFLRPDTGPCRADIIQWYFDIKEEKCFRFFWGGCQGNGNRFETKKECLNGCFLNTSTERSIPNFCSLAYDFGNCFGHYYRWYWDKIEKSCKRRLYSGCGGNQNNFETRLECINTCLIPPNNTLQRFGEITTCIPIMIPGMQ